MSEISFWHSAGRWQLGCDEKALERFDLGRNYHFRDFSPQTKAKKSSVERMGERPARELIYISVPLLLLGQSYRKTIRKLPQSGIGE